MRFIGSTAGNAIKQEMFKNLVAALSLPLLITTTVLLANFGVDLLIGVLDPRVRSGRQAES